MLYLPRLHSYLRRVETQELPNLHGIEFRGIESRRNPAQCMHQCMVDCNLAGEPKASADAGFLYPHKVPSGLTNHGVEDWREKFLYLRPVFANVFLNRVQAAGQSASLAQENRMPPHACALTGAERSDAGLRLATPSGVTASPPVEPVGKGASAIAGPECERLVFCPR